MTDEKHYQRQEARLRRAEIALKLSGHTYKKGAVAWKPPINETAGKLHRKNAELEMLLDNSKLTTIKTCIVALEAWVTANSYPATIARTVMAQMVNVLKEMLADDATKGKSNGS